MKGQRRNKDNAETQRTLRDAELEMKMRTKKDLLRVTPTGSGQAPTQRNERTEKE